MHTLVVGIIGWMRVHRGLVFPFAGQVPQFKPASQLLLELEHVSPIYWIPRKPFKNYWRRLKEKKRRHNLWELCIWISENTWRCKLNNIRLYLRMSMIKNNKWRNLPWGRKNSIRGKLRSRAALWAQTWDPAKMEDHRNRFKRGNFAQAVWKLKHRGKFLHACIWDS